MAEKKENKMSKLSDDTMSQDMISKLPDDILSKILSLLELKEGIKTSILSKRWEKVWTLIHRISLDNDSYIRHPNLEEQVKRRISFNNFLTGILCGKRILSLTSFRLLYKFGFQDDDEFPFITKWIAAAVSPDLQNFDITFFRDTDRVSFNMPRALFECQNLKMLRLGSVKFKDENTLKNLLLGCPVLEELYLKKIYDGRDREQQNIFVFSPSMKILTVYHPECFLHPFCFYYVIEAPKLENLHFVEGYLSGFTITASPCLVSAVIHIYTRIPLPVTNFFQGISNVQNLELRTSQTIIFEDELANLPKLHNLIYLNIRWCENRNIIPCILQHSSHLKHLIFSDDAFCSNFIWTPPKWLPECLISDLEIIEIKVQWPPNKDEEHILKLIEYFFNNGKVLNKMIVTSPSNQFLGKVKKLLGSDIRLCIIAK